MIAYGMGHEANQDGYDRDDNPFPPQSYERHAWFEGWDDAENEKRG